MLDLNLNVINDENNNASIESHSAEEIVGSVTSNSSSNVDDSSSVFNFDILTVGSGTHYSQSATRSEIMTTRELFPINSSDGSTGSSSVCNSVGNGHWSSSGENNIWFSQIPSQKLPAAKKSRRGPRSRSSQYRGVTFYRRTGRWESHIWLVWLISLLIISLTLTYVCWVCWSSSCDYWFYLFF